MLYLRLLGHNFPLKTLLYLCSFIAILDDIVCFFLIQILLQVEEFAAARHLFKKCKKYGSADPEKVNLAYKTGLYTCELSMFHKLEKEL